MKSYFGMALCFGLAIATACLPEPLPIDGIPQLKPRIVVSSQVTSDQSVIVLLTKSVGALEAGDDSDLQTLINQIAINDAVVTLHHDEVIYTFWPVGNGLYSSDQIPLEVGDAYTLFVKSRTMGTVQASTHVHGKVPFDFLEAYVYNNGYDTLAEISFAFDDPSGSNFYMLNVQRITNETRPEDALNPEIFIELIRDKSFDGKRYTDTERVIARRDFMPGDTVGVFLSNISKEYFDFMQVRVDSRFNFSDFLGEPANYPTNVEGGLGFFNLYIPDVRILELKESAIKPF